VKSARKAENQSLRKKEKKTQHPHITLSSLMILLFGNTSDIHDTITLLNRDLRQLEIWANKWHITFSPPKCTFTVFSRSWPTIPLPLPPLTFLDSHLKQDQTPRLLGLHLDSSLRFTHHTSIIEGKALRRVNMIKGLLATPLNSNRSGLITLYKG
jgi:hypothetical protein